MFGLDKLKIEVENLVISVNELKERVDIFIQEGTSLNEIQTLLQCIVEDFLDDFEDKYADAILNLSKEKKEEKKDNSVEYLITNLNEKKKKKK